MKYIKLLKTKRIPVPDTVAIKRDPESTGLILSHGMFSITLSNFLEEDEAIRMIDKLVSVKV